MELRSHYVATGYIYDRQKERFLLIEHKKLGVWLAPGGHLEDGEEPHAGALREVQEEIGLSGRIVEMAETPRVATPEVPQLPTPFCILSEHIPASPRDGEHIHIDFVYVVEINSESELSVSQAEIVQARWFAANEIDDLATFPNVRQVCRAISRATRAS